MNIFDMIFLNVSRRVIGLRFFAILCALFGFGMGRSIPVPILVALLCSKILFSSVAISECSSLGPYLTISTCISSFPGALL